jgi:AraC-like DNA-binding protein
MNVHSCDTRFTSIAFSFAKLAQAKNSYLRSRAKIRQRISKQCKAPPFRLLLTELEVIEMLLAHEESIPKHRAEPVQIWKARKFIEAHSDGELSLRKVAKAVNISANHLSEKFKQVTGMNFVEYIAHTRFKNACHLLRNSNLRVSEIAFAVGFQSLSQFNRVFKKLSGKSPTQYRAARRTFRSGR